MNLCYGAVTFIVLLTGESLKVECDKRDAAGTITEKMKETYKGIEVYDAIVTVHKTEQGQLTGEASGEIIQEIEEDLPDLETNFTDEETLHIALIAEGDNMETITNVEIRKEIYMDNNNRARLVNVLSYLIDGVKRPFYIIDLKNGAILRHWQGLNSKKCRSNNYQAVGGNERTGKISYGDKPYCLQMDVKGKRCFLENKYVRVVDMKNKSETYKKLKTASFDCNTGYNDQVNGGYSPATDAFFHGSIVGSMFKDWFDSKPLKDKIVIRVHYGISLENAFWDGRTCAFGDGSDYTYPLTSVDVIGHEIGHGVTEQNSGLVYYGESGGVDEAFCDMIGEAAEEYLMASDLLMGHDVMKYENYLREFKKPDNDKMSISNVKDMVEDMDPHYSSGIYRRVWYVLTTGGMPIRHAAAVFLHANRMFWHKTSSFYDCSCGVLKAALDLGYDTAPFRDAFSDVGIEPCDVSKFVFTLYNNETRRDIQVGRIVNPVFKIEIPPWANNFVISVKNGNSEQFKIKVTTGGWEQAVNSPNTAVDVSSGTNSVTIPDPVKTDYFIKVSLQSAQALEDDTAIIDADIKAGYRCLSNYTPNSSQLKLYKRDCRKRRKSL
jgi:Zn-dependent metalloprotease